VPTRFKTSFLRDLPLRKDISPSSALQGESSGKECGIL
jgi:hypothetical protein